MKKSTLMYILLGVVAGLYLVLTLTAPLSDASRAYQASLLQLRLIQLTIVVPVIGIWVIALWGSLKFKNYAQSIIGSKDGSALNQVANGLLVLVFGLALSTTFQGVQTRFRGTPWFENWVVMGNYIDMLSVLAAFSLIFHGAWKLGSLVKFKGLAKAQATVVGILLVLGTSYAWLLGVNPYRQATPDVARIVPYYLPDWLLIATIVIPYLLAWYLGLMAAMSIQMYQHHSPGIIYRKAAKHLSTGLLAVVVSSVLIQMLGAVAPSLRHLGLAGFVLLLYILILAYGVGHVLVANGARQLSKLEEAV